MTRYLYRLSEDVVEFPSWKIFSLSWTMPLAPAVAHSALRMEGWVLDQALSGVTVSASCSKMCQYRVDQPPGAAKELLQQYLCQQPL